MCVEGYRQLAQALKAPPMFIDVLPLIVKHDEVELLLKLSEKELSTEELSMLLNASQTKVKSQIKSLFKRGFLKAKKDKEMRYSAKPFPTVVSRYLSEGRTDALKKYVTALIDYRMKEHVKRAKVDPCPESKVLPIPQANKEPLSVVLPYDTAIDVLERAKSFSIRNCECRVTYKKCNKPLRTCLALNDFSDELVERGVAKRISLNEAKEALQIADEHGLVHQAIYSDWLRSEVFDICSCCSCCCQYLRTFINYGVKHHIARSGLVAKVDSSRCTGCAMCIARCIFNARKLENEKSFVIEENCYGCGLCTTTCPTKASKLVSVNP